MPGGSNDQRGGAKQTWALTLAGATQKDQRADLTVPAKMEPQWVAHQHGALRATWATPSRSAPSSYSGGLPERN